MSEAVEKILEKTKDFMKDRFDENCTPSVFEDCWNCNEDFIRFGIEATVKAVFLDLNEIFKKGGILEMFCPSFDELKKKWGGLVE